MKTKVLYSLRALILMLFVSAADGHAGIRWHWEAAFSAQEQRKLTTWITRTLDALENLVAPLPFDVDVHFYRLAGRGEPVPWANTRRGLSQGVNFHVDPSFPLESFHADWTAPHELSHLLIPFLGEKNSWFAEGFASYMQYQIMRYMGVLDTEAVVAAYRARMARARSSYSSPGTPLATASRELRRAGDYPTYYWGGAVYFLRADTDLRQRNGNGLSRLLREYLACCRARDSGLAGLVLEFDQIAGRPLFSDLLREFREQPGFPDYGRALKQLEVQLASNGGT